MKPGIYHVRFRSSLGAYGEGLVVFKDGTLNGGDPGYVYSGTYELAGEQVTGRLRIKKWNQGVTSVFGLLAPFEIALTGTFNPDFGAFDATGRIAAVPLTPAVSISGRRLSDAA